MKHLLSLQPDGYQQELDDLYREESAELSTLQTLPVWQQFMRSAGIQYNYARKRMYLRFGKLWMCSSFR